MSGVSAQFDDSGRVAAPEVLLGGLFLDVFLGYLFRALANSWKCRGSGRWPSTNATVTAEPRQASGFGGTTIEVVYSYRFEGELYTGMHGEPVLFSSAENYMARFTAGTSFIVRVKPGEPEVSVVREIDQEHLAFLAS